MAIASDPIKEIAAAAASGSPDALQQLQAEVEAGNVGAIVCLAFMYDEPDNLPNFPYDLKKARSLYKRAAEAGNAFAQMSFANMCHYGQGGEEDLELAFKWYLAAAEQGEPESQMHVARIYEAGRIGEPNLVAAESWYMKAVENGHELAATNLGLMYYQAAKNDADYEKSFQLFSFAADKGDGLAHYHLAHMHVNGHGVEQSIAYALLHAYIAEALLPPNDSRQAATEFKELILRQNPDCQKEYERRTEEYLIGKGFKRLQ